MMPVLYFAGGCFWGIEHAFRQLDGVLGTAAGYANGHVDNPAYSDVKHGDTGHKETVEVVYDPSVVSVQTLLKAFFILIDPERDDGQGNDIGDQYRTAVYYPADADPALVGELESGFAAEKARHSRFFTELGPLTSFFDAEDYHQDYLVKNPNGYCHVSVAEFRAIRELNRR